MFVIKQKRNAVELTVCLYGITTTGSICICFRFLIVVPFHVTGIYRKGYNNITHYCIRYNYVH